MAKLLTAANYLQINAAVQDLADTFFVTPCTVEHFTGNFGLFNEGNSKNFDTYELNCLYEDMSTSNSDDLEGSEAKYAVKLTFHYADMPTEIVDSFGLIIFSSTDDYVTVKGKKYKIAKIPNDAPLTELDLLYTIYCERLQKEN